MTPLAQNLHDAAAYAVAETVATGLISIDNEGVNAIAAAVVVAVLDDLASREEQCREVTPKGETTNSRDECSLRVMEYRSAADELRTR
jgi:hypothetical protein